jgi:nucleotide-binding universal stress UspA family protein
MELRRILVPLDGSDVAEQALPLAEQLAERAGAELVLARAPLARIFSSLDAVEASEAEDTAQAEAEAYLRSVREPLERRGVRVQTATPRRAEENLVGPVARSSFPFRQLADIAREAAEAITREAAERTVDLVVMATHSRSGLGRWIYGDEALEVLHRASMPVLLVRSGAPDTLPEGEKLRILVPLDGSALGEAALAPAGALAELLGGSLLLVRVVPALGRSVVAWLTGPLMTDPTEHAALEAVARTYLETTRQTLVGRGTPAATMVLEGNPAEVIVDATREQGCALVAIATHGRMGLARVASEHVAEAVMATAPALVLAVAPADPEAQELLTTSVEAGDPARAPAAVATAATAVSLTAAERELVRTALLSLLQTVRRDEHLGEPIRQLLAKLGESESRAEPPPA